MVGDQEDFVRRLKGVLPSGWFPLESTEPLTPVLTALLNGPAWTLSWIYALTAYAKAQARISTATDVWLDIIAQDFFGTTLERYLNETDAAFAARIKRNLFAPKATRQAMIDVLTALTGHAPKIFEPGFTFDTGGWSGVGVPTWEGLAYGFAGGYGSLALPFQAFITAYRPVGQGIGNIAGWGGAGDFNVLSTETGVPIVTETGQGISLGVTGYLGMPGGYGVGAIEWANPAMTADTVTDQEIYDTIARTAPAGTIMWTAITNAPPPGLNGGDVLVTETGTQLITELGEPILVSTP